MEDYSSHKALHGELLRFGGYRQGAIRRLPASQLTESWLKNNGTFRPVLVPAPEGGSAPAGAPPPSTLTPDAVAAALGPTFEVQTLDVPSQQEGPTWTLHQWSLYWAKRTVREAGTGPVSPGEPGPAAAAAPPAAAEEEVDSRVVRPRSGHGQQLKGIHADYARRLLALPELALAGTALAGAGAAPAAVQRVDLRRSLGLEEALPDAGPSPTLGMFPAKSFLNSSLAPAGATTWVRLVSGTASLALTPPTPRNLATYVAWARSGRHTGAFLPSSCEGVARADLAAGDFLLVPPGWTACMAVTASAVVVGGAFLRADALATHLDALRIEEGVGVRPRRRYPDVRRLLWRVAAAYADALGAAAARGEGGGGFEARVAARAQAMEREDRAAAAKAVVAARARAAAAPAAPRTAGGAAAARRPGARPVRRRRSPTDSFVESDGDDYFGVGDEDEEDEAEWVPDATGRRGADSEPDEDDEFGALDDDEMVLESDEDDLDGEPQQRRAKRARRGSPPAAAPAGVRSSARRRGRLPPKLAAALRGEDYEEGFEGGEEEGAGAGEAPSAFAAAPPMKLKIKLGGGVAAPAAAPAGDSAPAPKPPTIKLKLKPFIPQTDGAGDDAGDGGGGGGAALPSLGDDLSEGEEQGLAALLGALRQWLREGSGAAAAAGLARPWAIAARLELGMKARGLPTDPPMCTCLTAVDPKTLEQTGPSLQEPAGAAIGGAGAGGGGTGGDSGEAGWGAEESEGTAREDESGDNAAMFEDEGGAAPSTAPRPAAAAARPSAPAPTPGTAAKKSAAAAPPRPGAAKDPKAKAMKKLSTKDRLKKKLGL